MPNLRQFVTDFGWPRIIIFFFLALLFVVAPFVGVRMDASLSDVINRFGQNALFVLAMVPMIQAGCGLNFGLSVGIIAGLIGATLSIQLELVGFLGFFGAVAFAIPFAVLFGWVYGKLLNKVKGEEMTIAMYVGFAGVMFMCIMWLVLPYNGPTMVWGYAGKGLRTTISVEGYWSKILNDFLAVRIGKFFIFPTGLILFVCFCAFLMWLFLRTKTGTAMTAVGSNPDYARASGISVDKMRTISVMLSTLLGAVGIIVYEQSFGFIQLYDSPLFMGFPAVAALLIGGASVNKASMVNVLVGTILFQGLLTMTPSVINSLLQNDMSEVIRIMVGRFHQAVPRDFDEQAARLKMETHAIVTLASLIEKEVQQDGERPLISAVFHNRLRQRMPLQSDPTAVYMVPRTQRRITASDLQRKTPYNTYLLPGLPPGPIANPGLASIQAALSPAPVNFLYFVAKNDGSHQFSRTLEQHQQAVRLYQGAGKASQDPDNDAPTQVPPGARPGRSGAEGGRLLANRRAE